MEGEHCPNQLELKCMKKKITIAKEERLKQFLDGRNI